jgi:hypothetical protein
MLNKYRKFFINTSFFDRIVKKNQVFLLKALQTDDTSDKKIHISIFII